MESPNAPCMDMDDIRDMSVNFHCGGKGDYLAPPPAAGATPQEIADYNMAQHLQQVEQVGAGTVQAMAKIISEEKEDAEARAHRTERSNYILPKRK